MQLYRDIIYIYVVSYLIYSWLFNFDIGQLQVFSCLELRIFIIRYIELYFGYKIVYYCIRILDIVIVFYSFTVIQLFMVLYLWLYSYSVIMLYSYRSICSIICSYMVGNI